jgi:hypothetical protein
MRYVNPSEVVLRPSEGAKVFLSLYLSDKSHLSERLADIPSLDLHVTRSLRELRSNPTWKNQNGPFAIFLSPQFSGFTLLPFPVKDLAVVADSFHVKPLLKWLQRSQSFFVLKFEHRKAQFLKCSASGILWKKDFQQGVNQSPSEFLEFIRVEIRPLVSERQDPLLLLGPLTATSSFRDLCTELITLTPRLPSYFHEAQLHQHLMMALEPYFQQAENARLQIYQNAESLQQTCHDLDHLARLALEGEIVHLFVSEGHQIWGRIDSHQKKIIYHPRKMNSQDDDVLDDLSEIVLHSGGTVTVLSPDRMPREGTWAVAVLKNSHNCLPPQEPERFGRYSWTEY